jgi:hypothetical protein
MRKGTGSIYDRWNISVVICDTYSKMVSPGIVRQINYQSVLYLYPVVPCGVESSQLKLLTLRYECVALKLGVNSGAPKG